MISTTIDRVEVGIRELRLNLSRYVARARQGTIVVVTDHGSPVARLGPVEAGDDVFARLVHEGLITPGRRPNGRPLPPLVDPRGVTGSVSDLVLEDRG
jgi:prevent-host-death family protein